MGLVLSCLEGKRHSLVFGREVEAVRENPNDIDLWNNLVAKIKHRAACESHNRDYAQIWHTEALEVYNKALEVNPTNPELLERIADYKDFLNIFGYSTEQN